MDDPSALAGLLRKARGPEAAALLALLFAGRPLTSGELTGRTSYSIKPLRQAMRGLEGAGLASRDGAGRWSLAPRLLGEIRDHWAHCSRGEPFAHPAVAREGPGRRPSSGQAGRQALQTTGPEGHPGRQGLATTHASGLYSLLESQNDPSAMEYVVVVDQGDSDQGDRDQRDRDQIDLDLTIQQQQDPWINEPAGRYGRRGKPNGPGREQPATVQVQTRPRQAQVARGQGPQSPSREPAKLAGGQNDLVRLVTRLPAGPAAGPRMAKAAPVTTGEETELARLLKRMGVTGRAYERLLARPALRSDPAPLLAWWWYALTQEGIKKPAAFTIDTVEQGYPPRAGYLALAKHWSGVSATDRAEMEAMHLRHWSADQLAATWSQTYPWLTAAAFVAFMNVHYFAPQELGYEAW